MTRDFDANQGTNVPETFPEDAHVGQTDLVLRLAGKQRALCGALDDKTPKLRLMYVGALHVLKNEGNPDRHALAAHGLRELMEKLPGYVDVATPAHNESLMGKVREVQQVWDGASKRSRCSKDGGWSGEVDSHLGGLLTRLRLFFIWLEDHQPRRRDEIKKTLDGLDDGRSKLPDKLADLNVSGWIEIRDYFVGVSHHKFSTTQEDFDRWLGALENALLEKLIPRTFDDFAEIDAILEGT